MLRRFRAPAETPAPPDSLATTERLLRAKTDAERCGVVLKHLAKELPGEVRGYVVLGSEMGEYRFEAVQGYGMDMLVLTPQHGPWRDPRARIIRDLPGKLFSPNDKETRSELTALGLRDTCSSLSVPLQSDRVVHGTLMLHRHSPEPFSDDELKRVEGWGNVLGSALGLSGGLARTRQSLLGLSTAFVEAIEAQDFALLGHARRVTTYALTLGKTLNLKGAAQRDLYFAAMFHDLGKLGSPDPSAENSEHPLRGANLVASTPLLARAAEGIRAHHEHWDGSGFPYGLRGEEIPLLGRIVAVADVYDLLSSDRGHGLPMHEAQNALERRSGSQLDPNMVPLFVNILHRGKTTAELGGLESELSF